MSPCLSDEVIRRVESNRRIRMDIIIYGSGCARCRALAKAVETALQEMSLTANVKKVSDFKEMMAAGILQTPALSLDGKVVSSGRIPDANELRLWLTSKHG